MNNIVFFKQLGKIFVEQNRWFLMFGRSRPRYASAFPFTYRKPYYAKILRYRRYKLIQRYQSTINPNVDYYKILGIPENASQNEIKNAYRKLALKWHPDRNEGSGKKQAQEMFCRIAEAYAILEDREKRQHYDALRHQQFKHQVPYNTSTEERFGPHHNVYYTSYPANSSENDMRFAFDDLINELFTERNPHIFENNFLHNDSFSSNFSHHFDNAKPFRITFAWEFVSPTTSPIQDGIYAEKEPFPYHQLRKYDPFFYCWENMTEKRKTGPITSKINFSGAEKTPPKDIHFQNSNEFERPLLFTRFLPKLNRWLFELLGSNFYIKFLPGLTNILSQIQHSTTKAHNPTSWKLYPFSLTRFLYEKFKSRSPLFLDLLFSISQILPSIFISAKTFNLSRILSGSLTAVLLGYFFKHLSLS